MRSFTLLLLLGGLLMSSAIAGEIPAPLPLKLTDAQRKRLNEALASKHKQYDPKERMLRHKFSSPGYHTTLKGGMVHGTRATLNYAVACLDTGDEELLKRAEDILLKMVSLQDQNPKSKTYGIWSWFLEEPLEKMSPPDWNWADFCGVQLLQVALYHRARIQPKVMAKVDESIRHAAHSIQRRNVGPGYTNIALMGTYVTMVTAELYGMEDLHAYAMARLERFHAYTQAQGAFTEYNSPTYTMVALEELGRMRLHFRDAGARKRVEELYHFAWYEIARHFHTPSRQWAGPHSRAYRSLIGDHQWSVIDEGTGGQTRFAQRPRPRLDEARLPLPCPGDLIPYFTEPKLPRSEVETFVKANGKSPAVIGTTYLHPAFALGSINRGQMWNQRRGLLAHWGTPEKPVYLQVRLLHDDYDFSAGQLFAVQKEGRAIAGINLAVDTGDRHISLDRIRNATIKASDIRLRFEFGGATDGLQIAKPKNLAEPIRVAHSKVHISFGVPYAKWSAAAGRWECGSEKGRVFADVVLFHADTPQTIKLDRLSAAVMGFWVSFSTKPEKSDRGAKVTERDDRLFLAWDDLKLNIPVRPAKARVQQSAFRH
jgi:hypothetical protein